MQHAELGISRVEAVLSRLQLWFFCVVLVDPLGVNGLHEGLKERDCKQQEGRLGSGPPPVAHCPFVQSLLQGHLPPGYQHGYSRAPTAWGKAGSEPPLAPMYYNQ